MRSSFHGGTLGLFCAVALLGTVASFADEPAVPSSWREVRKLRPGQTVWISTRDDGMTEHVMASATDDEIRLALTTGDETSGASEGEVTEFCASARKGQLAVDGTLFAFARLCRVVPRSDVLEVYVRKRSSPLRAILIGAVVGGGAMVFPCQVAPQGDASAAGCTLGSVAVGALVGWGVHGARQGKLVKIYALEDPD